MSIPKTIHYVWLGGNPLPELAVKCIDSWRNFCPDYQIKLWNEENLAIDNPYYKRALAAKKWAFASDYARLWVVNAQGGIYLDSDVELLKPLDPLLSDGCYVGEEAAGCINTGLGFGAVAGHPLVRAMLEEYDAVCADDAASQKFFPCPSLNTAAFEKFGYHEGVRRVGDCAVYPQEYFSPLDFATGLLNVTPNSVSIHHFSGSWLSKAQRCSVECEQKMLAKHSNMPTMVSGFLSKMAAGFKTGDFSLVRESLSSVVLDIFRRG